MNVGQLFVLFGLKVNKKSFNEAHGALKALKAATAINGIVQLGRSLTHLVTSAGQAGIHIKALSQQMGMTSRHTQEWGYIAEQAGSNVDELSIGMVRLAKNMRALAKERNTIGTRALLDTGITTNMARNALKDPEAFQQVLFQISKRYQELGNTATRAGLANETFGRQAKSMVSDLARGPEELKKLIDAVNARHAIISDKEIDQLAHLGNRIHNITQELRSFAYQAIAGAAPALLKMLDAATRWIVTHKGLIDKFLNGALKVLMVLFEGLFRVFDRILETWDTVVEILDETGILDLWTKAFGVVKGLITWIGDNMERVFGKEGIQALILTIVGLMLGALMSAIVAVGVAIWTAMAPLLLPTAIIFSIILAVLLLRKYWDDITAFIRNRWDGISAKFKATGEWFKRLPGIILGALGAVAQAIHDAVDRIGHAIVNGARHAWHAFVDAARAACDQALAFFHDTWARIRELPGIKQALAVEHFINPSSALDDVIREAKARATTNAASPPLVTNGMPRVGIRPLGDEARAAADRGPRQVSVGPTTINLYGVKDAHEAKDSIADSIDGVHRHAAAALGGEVE